MYCTTQTNYKNNKGCNQCGSCWRYSICSKNHNIKYRTISRELEYGTTSKGLVQCLKNKIINVQNESFKQRNNRNKPSTKKQQKDYYCLMLRKISTLDRKLQNLEDLLLSHLDYESGQSLSSRDSKTINCKYLNFHESISSLLNLANKLKVEMVFRKHNMQSNNENSSEIYNKILALESELQDFSSYLKHLQINCDNKGRKSLSQGMHKRFQNSGESNDKFIIGNKLKSHNSGKKYNKEPVAIKNKTSNNSKHGFKEEAPVSANLVQTSKSYGSPFDKCQCVICRNLTYFNHLNDNSLKDNPLAKNGKYKKVINDDSICLSHLCNISGKKRRNRNINCDVYKVNDNLSICSCSSCENTEGKHDNSKHQKDIRFHNAAGTHIRCASSETNKNCFHRTQKTFIKRGTRVKPFYNAVEVSRLQPKPNNTKCGNAGNRNIFRHQFKNNLPLITYSSMESSVDSFEEIPNTKNFKQMQTKPVVINHRYMSQDSTSRRMALNETLTNDIVYYEATPEKAKNIAKGTNHKKHNGFNEGKTKQFRDNSYQKRCKDYMAEQENHCVNRNSNIGNVKATRNQSEKIKRFPSKSYNSTHLKNNKLRKDDYSCNILDSGSGISTINESCFDGLQNLGCNRNSKLGYQILQNTHNKIPNKTYLNENDHNIIVKQNREKDTENYHNTHELFEDDFQNKSWQYHKKRRNDFYKKEPNDYNPHMLGRNHNFYKSRNNKTWKSGNISESLESMHLKDVNSCKYDPTYKENQNHVDLTTDIKEKDSSSSNEISSFRKFVDNLNETENDVCGKCIIKEKKIKVPSRYMKHLNCKNGVKIIIKKEIIRCPDCTGKFDSNVFNVNDKNSKTELNQKLYSTFYNERAEENKEDHSTKPKKKVTDEINTYTGPNSDVHLINSIIRTKNDETQYLGNGGAVSICQTNLDQDNIFTKPTLILPTKSPGSQRSSINISASYEEGFDDVRKSSRKSNELINEATAKFKNKSPIGVNINKIELPMNGILINTSHLSKPNDKETKYMDEENIKTNYLPSLLLPLTTNDTLNKPNYSNEVETNIHDKLYNGLSEIVDEVPLVNSQEKEQVYLKVDNRENKNNKFLPNKVQYQNEANSINLVSTKNNLKNGQEKDTKLDFGIVQLEGNDTSHNMFQPKNKAKNCFNDFKNNLDKTTANKFSLIKRRNTPIRNNSFIALHNRTNGHKGYNYSNNVPNLQISKTRNNKCTPFSNKYKNFDNISKCNCFSSSSTSKGTSFTVPSRYNLNISKRLVLKKPIRPTFNVGRRSSKPLKYWHINYCRLPSRTINQMKKPALDYTKLTLSPDAVPLYELSDNSNDKFTTTVTSESSFSVVNWATIAQKLKEEKY